MPRLCTDFMHFPQPTVDNGHNPFGAKLLIKLDKKKMTIFIINALFVETLFIENFIAINIIVVTVY